MLQYQANFLKSTIKYALIVNLFGIIVVIIKFVKFIKVLQQNLNNNKKFILANDDMVI